MMNNSKKEDSLGIVRGFTLMEVVIALAIFAILIGGLLGFLPWGVDGVAKVRERSVAYGLVDGVQIELERMGFSVVEAGTKRLDGLYLAVGEPVDSQDSIFEVALVADKTGRLVSFEGVYERGQSRSGSGGKLMVAPDRGNPVKSINNETGGVVEFDRYEDNPISLNGFEFPKDEKAPAMSRWLDEEDRYYLVVCRQFAKQTHSDSEPPSRHFHHPSNGYLALQVEVQWPYKLKAGNDDFQIIEERFRSKFKFPLAIAR